MNINNSIKLDVFNEVTGNIFEKCTDCNRCQKDCGFLQKYGTPGEIAGIYNKGNYKFDDKAFECSLCSLCTAVCPENIDPVPMFLAMRRKLVKEGKGIYSKHASIVKYEKKGTSKKYSIYIIPENCDTVFFPGCALTGTRPSQTLKTFQYLKEKIPSLGVVLDCCTKPSHDLGRQDYFNSMFYRLIDYLNNNMIKNIIVACPNCYKVFNSYGVGLNTISVYEVMNKNGFSPGASYNGRFIIHDPCVSRFDKAIQNSVRSLAQNNGLEIKEPKNTGNKTFCCGEGGSAGFINPSLSSGWAEKRTKDAEGTPIISYCAGCVNFLGKKNRAFHILDFLFEPEKTLAGKQKVARAPFTYLNRLKVKRRLKKQNKSGIVRER